jgi:Aerotolerance regulator N-terminal
MVWLHPALLIGLALTALPVLLHLLMRAKPKKLVFPALRLIQNRRKTNVRRLRLRHLALLLLRMAVIALVVLAVARPSVPATDYAPRAGDWLRLAILAAVIAAVYRGALWAWNRRNLPRHELTYRRSYLRAGLATAGVAAFILLVAWPYQRRIAAAITQPTLAASEFLPVAAVLVFDTSLSMQYRFENRTRLEAAQDIATRHLGSLPRSSRAAVTDTAGDTPIRFQGDLGTAVKRIAELAVNPLSRSLDDRLTAALEAQLDDRERTRDEAGGNAPDLLREIYVFTDLAVSAWRPEESPRLKEALARAGDVSVYLIDLGVVDPTNLALTDLVLAEQSVPRGGEVTLRATLQAVGPGGDERVVELHVENEAGRLIKQEQQSLKVEAGGAAAALFTLRATGGPSLRGEVRVAASDPLPFDDVRYFSLRVEPVTEVLIVAENRADAVYLTDVLSPSDLAAAGRVRYRCTRIPPARLSNTDLSKYPVACLVNVGDPQPAGWSALAKYVEGGGQPADRPGRSRRSRGVSLARRARSASRGTGGPTALRSPGVSRPAKPDASAAETFRRLGRGGADIDADSRVLESHPRGARYGGHCPVHRSSARRRAGRTGDRQGAGADADHVP